MTMLDTAAHARTTSPHWPTQRATLLRTSLCVALAVAVYGLAFGALAVSAGFTLAQTCAMSLLMFNGASQLAFVGVLGAGGSVLVAVLSALLIGARNAAYGVRLAPMLAARGAKLLVAVALTIDESTALAIANERAEDRGRAGRFGFWSAGIAVYALWNLATLIGALAATQLGDPRALGLDTAVAAGLAGLVWSALHDIPTRVAAGVAVVVAVLLTPVVPAGMPVIMAGLLAVAGVSMFDPVRRHRRPGLPARHAKQRAFGTAA